MMSRLLFLTLALLSSSVVFAQSNGLSMPGEKRLQNIKQLTNGGENAEAYFSFDGKRLIFQSKRDNLHLPEL